MNDPYTTRTTVNPALLAAYTSAVLLARHAYRADTAEPVAPTCTCDECAAFTRRLKHAAANRAYRARKKAA